MYSIRRSGRGRRMRRHVARRLSYQKPERISQRYSDRSGSPVHARERKHIRSRSDCLSSRIVRLDPHASGNALIVNVTSAALNTKGHVEYSVDIAILKPVDTAKGNGRLLYDVVNRGKNTALNHLNDSGDTFAASDTGNGFLMKRG